MAIGLARLPAAAPLFHSPLKNNSWPHSMKRSASCRWPWKRLFPFLRCGLQVASRTCSPLGAICAGGPHLRGSSLIKTACTRSVAAFARTRGSCPPGSLGLFFELQDHPVMIVAAARTYAVGQAHFVALGATGKGCCAKSVMSASFVATSLGCFSLWYTHFSFSLSIPCSQESVSTGFSDSKGCPRA